MLINTDFALFALLSLVAFCPSQLIQAWAAVASPARTITAVDTEESSPLSASAPKAPACSTIVNRTSNASDASA